MDNVSEYKYLTAAAPSSGGEASTASWSRTTPNCFIAPILVDFLRSSAACCGNSRHYDKDQLEEIVMQEVKESILDAGYLEEYYQQCLERKKPYQQRISGCYSNSSGTWKNELIRH